MLFVQDAIERGGGKDGDVHDLRVTSTLHAPSTINVFVPPLHPIAPGDDENKAASASAEDVAVMREMEKEYAQVFNGGFTMMPVLIYLFMGWRGAQYARDAHKERAGLRSTRLLHKWIKPPSSDDYVVNYLSRMGGVFLPLLTIFSTTLLSMVGVGQDFLLLKGNEEWGILGFTLVLSVSILLSLVGAICKRYIYYRLLSHGVLVDFVNPDGLKAFLAADRYHVTILSLLYAGWSLFIVLQLATRAKQGATAVVAPAITVFTEAFLLLNFNATVLNVETTALATLNKLVEDVKATYGNADKYVQGALAFLTSPYGIRTVDEDSTVEKQFELTELHEKGDVDNAEGIYLRNNLRNVIVRVRNERTTYLMHLLGYELGQSTADFTARLWDWEGNVAKYREACDEIVRAGLMRGGADLPEKIQLAESAEAVEEYNHAVEVLLRRIKKAMGFHWLVFWRNVLDYVTLLPLRRVDYAEKVSQRVFFALNHYIAWSEGVKAEDSEYGPMEAKGHALYWERSDVLCVGWHHVMSAEFGMKRHQEWLRTREAQEKNKETVQALFGELRIRDYIWRVITGDYFAFLNESTLGSIEDKAFACLARQLTRISFVGVLGFMAYTSYLVYNPPGIEH